ncbi:hypothetical protein LY625_09410 [Lysobacter sp. GX 14042]|uniref:hypothetical protein n=1 Tax=Lysobacter sp. GX 14042 TaxID=2907155 RepID=UPI001F1A0930|nr:hypothetical protein [Lysobacter sp. GX 14042]MCE7032825.1 hypothetical protein [Lysobacter sp. GX 14042]
MKSSLAPLALLLAAAAFPAWGQETRTVIQAENVRFAYAQVLQVTPVYQTLTATAVEQECDPAGEPAADADGPSRLQRVVGRVRDALGGSDGGDAGEPRVDCRTVPVQREFRRPIAYDVDYDYKGLKFRSRLPDDPGNRLRIRVGVTPVVVGDHSE